MERAISAVPHTPHPVCSPHESPGPTVHTRLPKCRAAVGPVRGSGLALLTREQVLLQDVQPGQAWTSGTPTIPKHQSMPRSSGTAFFQEYPETSSVNTFFPHTHSQFRVVLTQSCHLPALPHTGHQQHFKASLTAHFVAQVTAGCKRVHATCYKHL